MTNVLSLSKAQLLAIPALEPEKLFGKPDQIHDRFKVLAQKWHPDHLNGDNDVFRHILALRKHATELFETGTWHIPGELKIHFKW